MEINKNALKWLLKVTNSDVDDLVKWFRRWQQTHPLSSYPCLSQRVGFYLDVYVISWTSGLRKSHPGSQAVLFNKNTKLVDDLTLEDVTKKFSRDSSFRRELIDTLRKTNLED